MFVAVAVVLLFVILYGLYIFKYIYICIYFYIDCRFQMCVCVVVATPSSVLASLADPLSPPLGSFNLLLIIFQYSYA